MKFKKIHGALKALKYFNENENDYHIVSAGSLLGVAIHQGTSFPVGKVDFLDLTPLSFKEFLVAIGKKELSNIIENIDIDLIGIYHEKIIEYLKLYYYIGGMPEVVGAYIKDKDLKLVRDIQNKLLIAYEQDFSKYAPTNIVPRIRALWNNIPTQLAKENKKFIYGLIKTGARAREYEIALSWLIDSGLIYQINRVNDNKSPISAYQDFNSFKLYILDVGLLTAKANIDIGILLEGSEIFKEFKGSLAEQYVLCEIKSTTNLEPFYYSPEVGISEIDFICQIGRCNVPIEVKAETNLQAKSLKTFINKFDNKINVRTSAAKYERQEQIINIPLYLIGEIQKIVENIK